MSGTGTGAVEAAPTTPADLDAHIDAMARAVRLDIPPACRPGIRDFLTLAAGMAAILDKVDLHDDDLALAPVYRLPDAG